MILAALMLAQAAAPAAPTCPATQAALPADLAGWRKSGGDLASGAAVEVATMDPATVRLAGVPLPERPGRMALQTVRIRAAGTYGIALDQRGWIDLYRTGSTAPLVSTKHGHGPACSGIRKIVRFALAPGEYRVVVGGLDAPRAKLLLVR